MVVMVLAGGYGGGNGISSGAGGNGGGDGVMLVGMPRRGGKLL